MNCTGIRMKIAEELQYYYDLELKKVDSVADELIVKKGTYEPIDYRICVRPGFIHIDYILKDERKDIEGYKKLIIKNIEPLILDEGSIDGAQVEFEVFWYKEEDVKEMPFFWVDEEGEDKRFIEDVRKAAVQRISVSETLDIEVLRSAHKNKDEEWIVRLPENGVTFIKY